MSKTQRSTAEPQVKPHYPPPLSLDAALALLSSDQQRDLCKAVIAEAIACHAEFRADAGDGRKWGNVVGQASDFISSIINATGLVPANGSEKTINDLAMPDLNGLGIKMCTVCGCTEDHACSGSCWWISETLCSRCKDGVPEADGTAEPREATEDDRGQGRPRGIMRHALEISTSHLQCGDRIFLEFAADPGRKDRVAAMVGPYGWLIATNTPKDQDGLSQHLSDLLDRVSALGCDYVLFSVEGQTIVGLPTFPTDTEAVDD